MQQLLLCFIFMGLGVGLWRNQKKARKRFENARADGILFSDKQEKPSVSYLQKGQLGVTCVMSIYLLISVFVPLSQTPILILLLVFLASYYAMHYLASTAWFFDKKGLWTSQANDEIGFENIVGYEWRDYKDVLILRIKYKGKGIMLISCDLVVAPNKKKSVAELLNKQMAGI